MQNQSDNSAGEEIRRFALVGPGKVGASLARWLVASGARLECISGRRRHERARDLERSAGCETTVWTPLDRVSTQGLDWLLIAVADPALDEVVATLARRPQARVVLHTAGQHGREILAPLRQSGCAVGAWHPLRAFPDVIAPSESSGTWFAVDGDEPAAEAARQATRYCDGELAVVGGEQRALYHLAATLAAGGVTTLMAVVEELLSVAGLPPTMLGAYLGLTRGALAPIEVEGGPVAPRITGPAARGEHASLRRQLEVLNGRAPHLVPLVERLQEETLRQCGFQSRNAPASREKIPPPMEGKRE